ncbi:sigma-54-dependent Fis family transcriptional regulator [bacterium]|nr:sigma-54-dependent Fis family transcriptional regulator [bacterium]
MHGSKNKILIVDDDKNISAILVNILDYEGYECEFASNGKSALAKLKKNPYDLVLLDLALPDISGLEVLKEAVDDGNFHTPQVVMISGQGTIHTALRATRMGAYDFLEKPLDSERILVTIKNALEKAKLERTRNRFLADMKQQYCMIGDSEPMKRVKELIRRAAETDSKVLIEGENGTGKELVARAIYYNSDRSGENFVTVNCAAIPETLVESELFGHKKGSFTDAVADKMGRFQQADRGTLFMDEIGDMHLTMQAKLLRALEDNSIEMIGSAKPIKVDVRIIAATNRDLQEEMRKGNFREDLYYRLNVLSIKLPPLRERRDDIPLLVDHFLARFCEEQGKEAKIISPRAMKVIMGYHWPGNVRELRNIIEKIVTLVDKSAIQDMDMSPLLKSGTSLPAVSDISLRDAKRDFERTFITAKLNELDWNISLAADSLQIPRTYLYKKMKNLNIEQAAG